MEILKVNVLTILLLAIWTLQCYGYQCCGFNKMDAEGVVLVEATRPLPRGRYQAIKFRGCGIQMLAIQLWTCDIGNYVCTFKWQTVTQAVVLDQSVNFEPIDVGVNDRLAVFTAYNSSAQLSIPFGQDQIAYLYRSKSMFSDSAGFSVGSQIFLNENPMPRSFAFSIAFCENKDCAELPKDALAPPTIIRDSINQPPLGQCCSTQTGCDSTPLKDQISQNDKIINQLQLQISILSQLINMLTDQARPITGLCPLGFTAGPYGLGSCYAAFYVPQTFAVATFFCRDNFVANLVSIGSAAEQQFLSRFIINQDAGPGQFWTSGMYQFNDRSWYWYDKIYESLQYQYYTKWKNGVTPTPLLRDDVCTNLVVERTGSNVTDYWVKTGCNEKRFFICKIPKICF